MGGAHSKTVFVDPAKLTSASVKPPAASFSSKETDNWTSFDYIIVGGGTAGCVLASRLTESQDVKVLVVEAGRFYKGHLLSRVPFAAAKNFRSDVDWAAESTPQPSVNNRNVYLPQGKILGGSSAINSMLYHRCSPTDFDEWERLVGPGWGYKDLTPYFNKSEKFATPSRLNINKSDHGVDGMWHVGEQAAPPPPINSILLETCQNLGVPRVNDLCTSAGTLGAAEFLTFMDRNGERSSAATAYLAPTVLARPNLKILVNTRVNRIVFDTTSSTSAPRAIGVEVSASRHGPRYYFRAAREVIVSSGTLGTPQVLMLSGIGPRETLDKFGIPLVKDSPAVGKGFIDQPSTGPLIIHTKREKHLTSDYLNAPLPAVSALLKWLWNGSGPLSGLPVPGGAFLRASDETIFPPDEYKSLPVIDNTSGPNGPDLEVLWATLVVLDLGNTTPPAHVNGVSFGVVALRPMSEGSISISSASVWDKPVMDSKFLANENDFNVLIRGMRWVLRLASTEPFKSVIDKTATEKEMPWIFPGHRRPDQVSDDELKAWLKETSASPFHPSSSARMGKKPEVSVVDTNLKVHGVEGLRVVDASIFPNQVSGHPCSVVIAVAERAADMIKDSY